MRACAGGAGAGVSVMVKEGFADEEDFHEGRRAGAAFSSNAVKQGHGEALPPIPIGDNVLDLVVIGCGPAALALAAESAKLGVKDGLIGPDLPFTNNYGVWEDELKDLELEGCIEHVWQNTIVYLDYDSDPIMIPRAYGRVCRDKLHEELLRTTFLLSAASYLDSRVESIVEASNGISLVACGHNIVVSCRLGTVASGAASGKLLQYEVGGPKVAVQTAYGIEVEVENNPYDPSVMASEEVMPFDLLKKKLLTRLKTEWSWIPVGGSLPNTEQKNLVVGAAACMVHPTTGYSLARSLSEAPKCASVIATILKPDHYKVVPRRQMTWKTLWPQEMRRQRAFFLFGPALILQQDTNDIRTFFHTFFRLPTWMWQGFLGSTLSSADLILFALYMFVLAPYNLRKGLVRHLLCDPSRGTMIGTYLTFLI
ncbi:lycopene epsilon cyclase [Pyrus ussuriensis x Pyrus communis]|uniref:Lycopene epsilon cyclase n=1 Tax=Pyrus ussuriensis x Pyrus communis TaxID=2448454 RepID=A0A5N5FN47_9ROSA|nr:lycopene epsilon cyclase [Pyrus ussuriensis x Pyrus communis]